MQLKLGAVDTVRSSTVTYSEIFRSIEGEGLEAGQPRLFLRLAGCNFRCSGFAAQDNDSQATELDPSNYRHLTDLPPIERGCDSIYSVDARFRHLWKKHSPAHVARELRQCLIDARNPDGKFSHPSSRMITTLSVTGGEPLLQQQAICAVVDGLERLGSWPPALNIETNGTQRLEPSFRAWVESYNVRGGRTLFTVSPKLSISGEATRHAVQPDVVSEYWATGSDGQLKFVVDGDDETWREVADVLRLYRSFGVNWPVSVMPVGGTAAQQREVQRHVAQRALDNGYAFSARLHCWVFDNEIGT